MGASASEGPGSSTWEGPLRPHPPSVPQLRRSSAFRSSRLDASSPARPERSAALSLWATDTRGNARRPGLGPAASLRPGVRLKLRGTGSRSLSFGALPFSDSARLSLQSSRVRGRNAQPAHRAGRGCGRGGGGGGGVCEQLQLSLFALPHRRLHTAPPIPPALRVVARSTRPEPAAPSSQTFVGSRLARRNHVKAAPPRSRSVATSLAYRVIAPRSPRPSPSDHLRSLRRPRARPPPRPSKMEASSSTAPPPSKAPRSQFLQKLHSILENPLDPNGLRWVTDDSFEISSKDAVAIHALSPAFEFHSCVSISSSSASPCARDCRTDSVGRPASTTFARSRLSSFIVRPASSSLSSSSACRSTRSCR